MDNHPIRLLHESLFRCVETASDKRALVIEGVSYTYRQLYDSALRLACGLNQRGLSQSDHVAIYMANTWPCVVSIYGVLLAGGVFIIVNPQTKKDKLKFILEDSEAAFLMTDILLQNNFVDVIKEFPNLKGVICSNYNPDITNSENIPLVESFDYVMESTGANALTPGVISLDLAALIYTSGSTGNPKGVMMTHHAMVFSAQSLIQYLRLSPEDSILNILPLAFDYGLYQLIMAVFLGATLILEQSFNYPAQIVNSVKQNGVSVFPGVPTIFTTLGNMHQRNPFTLPSVTRVTNTAASLPSDIQPVLKSIFPNALIYRMYGLTECKRVCYLEPELVDIKPNSVGKAIPGTQVFILSPEGKPVSYDTPGILYVRGEHVMKGYWNKPELSAQMLKPGPLPGEYVLCTQDWFKKDSDGDLYFIGRSDDIIKSRGEKVSPVEIENVLYGIPSIKEAAVLGIDDPIAGQAIKAFIVPKEHCTLHKQYIKRHCAQYLESFKIPQQIMIIDSLPKTANGKIDKFKLKSLNNIK